MQVTFIFLKSLLQRIWATLLALGAGFLFFRTIWLTAHGYTERYTWWVAFLLVVEMLVDLSCMIASIRWWIQSDSIAARRLTLRLTVAIVFLHAVRVAIFVVGCIGPWTAWDVRPEYRAERASTWTWTGFWIASIGAVTSLLVVLAVWFVMRRNRQKSAENPA